MKTSAMANFTNDELQRLDQFRKEHHTALLTILFVDLAESTHWAEKLGDEAYTKLMTEIESLLRRITEEQFHGMFIKNTGDGGLIVFAEPTAAVQAAEIIRESVQDEVHAPATNRPIEFRQGIHLGQVTMRETLSPDVFGKHVNRAARIADAANPNQILASYGVWDNVMLGSDDREAAWMAHGPYWLRGVGEAVPLFECLLNGLSMGKPRARPFKTPIDPRKLITALALLLVVSSAMTVILVVTMRRQDAENLSPGQSQLIPPRLTLEQIESARMKLAENISSMGKRTLQAEGTGPNPLLAEASANRDASAKIVDLILSGQGQTGSLFPGNLRRIIMDTLLENGEPAYTVLDNQWDPSRQQMKLTIEIDGEVLAGRIERSLAGMTERFRQRGTMPGPRPQRNTGPNAGPSPGRNSERPFDGNRRFQGEPPALEGNRRGAPPQSRPPQDLNQP